jgi:hypothetical protein
MRVSIPAYKRVQSLALLTHWLGMSPFTLQQVATLHGTFENLLRYCARARLLLFQNAMRSILEMRYFYLKRTYKRHRRLEQLEVTMPPAFATRISPLIQREQAQLQKRGIPSYR